MPTPISPSRTRPLRWTIRRDAGTRSRTNGIMAAYAHRAVAVVMRTGNPGRTIALSYAFSIRSRGKDWGMPTGTADWRFSEGEPANHTAGESHRSLRWEARAARAALGMASKA